MPFGIHFEKNGTGDATLFDIRIQRYCLHGRETSREWDSWKSETRDALILDSLRNNSASPSRSDTAMDSGIRLERLLRSLCFDKYWNISGFGSKAKTFSCGLSFAATSENNPTFAPTSRKQSV